MSSSATWIVAGNVSDLKQEIQKPQISNITGWLKKDVFKHLPGWMIEFD